MKNRFLFGKGRFFVIFVIKPGKWFETVIPP